MEREMEEITLTEILKDLQERGYTFDFGQEMTEEFDRKVTLAHQHYYNPNAAANDSQLVDLYVREVHRVEGMSNPSDNAIIYAIETSKGLKGFLVNAYGVYSENKQVENEAVTPQEVTSNNVYDNSKPTD
jgi:hypothetical protein